MSMSSGNSNYDSKFYSSSNYKDANPYVTKYIKEVIDLRARRYQCSNCMFKTSSHTELKNHISAFHSVPK